MPPSRRWRFFIDSSWKLEDLDRNGRADQSVWRRMALLDPVSFIPSPRPGHWGLIDARRCLRPQRYRRCLLTASVIGRTRASARTVGTATSASS